MVLCSNFKGEFPKDFGMLAVRAGKDYAAFLTDMNELTDWAQRKGVEVTIVDYADAVHGFDTSMDTPRTREIIGQTLEFMKEHLQAEKIDEGYPQITQILQINARICVICGCFLCTT